MSFINCLLLGLSCLPLLVYLGLIICWLINFKTDNTEKFTEANANSEYPKIAILVAARNEEKNISRCLDALLRLNYPKEKIQILVGNDDSNDGTTAIAQAYARLHSHIRLVEIKDKVGKADAKANVLAQLINTHKKSDKKANYYLITDADVAVNPEWAATMLSIIQNSKMNTGIITGVTLIEGQKSWAKLQCLDWLLGLGMVKVVSDLSIPVTTMGNNMLITEAAYEATGGYEKIPFSVTEDFALFHSAFKKGYRFRNVINPKVLAWSRPVPSVGELLQQRKRWMYGAIRLPFFMIGILWALAIFYPVAFFLFNTNPNFTLVIIGLKLILQASFINLVMNKLAFTKAEKFKLLLSFFLFEIYATLLTISTIIFYYLPVKIQWKDRKF